MVPEFKPKEGIKISANEAEEKKRQEEEASSSMVDVDVKRLGIEGAAFDDVAGGHAAGALRVRER